MVASDRSIILTGHQPAFAPWLPLISRIALADIFVVHDAAFLERHGFLHRNKIRTPDGWMYLTIPISHSERGRVPLRDLALPQGDWRRQHKRSLDSYYRRTRYYDDYRETVFAAYEEEQAYLPFVMRLMRLIQDAFSIQVKTVYSSALDLQSRKSDFALDLCRRFNANIYLSGSQGNQYLEGHAFAEEKIDVRFINNHAHAYPQAYRGFVPGLSALDLLFNVGSVGKEYLNLSWGSE